ncbi:MAG: GbsR/MarR family transcriptional regulator [Actinomycetota bacterium]
MGIFVDGIGAAAATSGVLTQLQGRIFALLYLHPEAVSLDEIAERLGQSKSNVSVNVRGLVEWHLVRRVRIPGSRKDHYEAATDFWRVMQEIMERRFRWNLRQVLATVEETLRAFAESAGKEERFVAARLQALSAFAAAVDAGIGAVVQGESFAPESVRGALRAIPIQPARKARR